MNLNQLGNFITIAKVGSFSKAETTLYVSKNALKKQIDSLEAELGFPLFIRSPRGLQLTEVGILFLNKMPTIMSKYRISG